MSGFFVTLCGFLELTHLKTKGNHQTSVRVKKYKEMIVAHLWNYYTKQKLTWNIFQPLTYAYITRMDRFTGVSSVCFVLSRRATGATTIDFLSAITLNVSGNVSPQIWRGRFLDGLVFTEKKFDIGLTAAQKRCKYDYDKRVRKKTAFKISAFFFQ